ncbi:MAG: histidine phosphatase family protein [Mogibacterium sp.]|nr:histidine phosphatase family protein [Mogibacterium sp.]
MLYIVRHGQTHKNKQKLLQGRSDFPLNEEGEKQAAEVRVKLAEAGIHPAIVYSSPLIRAVQTAQIIAESCQVIIDDRLIEMDYGPYEGMDLTNPAPEVMAFFMDFAGTPAPDGMEQLSSVVARSGEFLEDIRGEAAAHDVVIATHAIAMKGLLEYMTPGSNGGYWSKYIGNCDVYAAEADENGYGIPYPFITGQASPGV